jgi:transcriptional regulator with XRE-family HTH domain
MKRSILLTGPESDTIELLGRRIALARLRRNITQQDMADRIGVTRKTYMALERGVPSTNLGALVKTMTVLNYGERLADLLASDPLGEDMEAIHGRKRARLEA